MRDRLIELICERIQSDECIRHCNHPPCNACKNTADYLLENGVIVPPCKVGDTVYVCDRADVLHPIHEKTVKEFIVGDGDMVLAQCSWGIRYPYLFSCFGKTVFLTREEAEAALKKEGDGK